MFFIPGPLISIITFPGVIAHEIAHRFFAEILNIPVYDVCYFQVEDPSGYVIHGETTDLKKSFFISIGPLLVNTLLCALISFSAYYPMLYLDDQKAHPIFYILLWLGISIGMHAFPSNHDMQNFLDLVRATKKRSLLYGISWIFSFIIKIANVLRIVWFDFVYAIFISCLLPLLVLNFLN